MLLKEHESSRLLQHKAAIDQYTLQIQNFESELASESISDDTRAELGDLKEKIKIRIENETAELKEFTAGLQKKYDTSSFDDFMNLIVSAVNEAEKVLQVLPDDLRKPFTAIAEKVKSVLNFLKTIF